MSDQDTLRHTLTPTLDRNLAILYVEDDARSRKVMRLMLMQLGFTNVTIFEDSADFLGRTLAISPKPDVIFLDIHVKPHTGFEMLAMVRATPELANIPVVALTASVMNEEVDQMRSSGFNSCLAKPLHLESFPDLLMRILQGENIWRILG
jgi:CheY-like chemotaxis protein